MDLRIIAFYYYNAELYIALLPVYIYNLQFFPCFYSLKKQSYFKIPYHNHTTEHKKLYERYLGLAYRLSIYIEVNLRKKFKTLYKALQLKGRIITSLLTCTKGKGISDLLLCYVSNW